jgi:hypothetical protein
VQSKKPHILIRNRKYPIKKEKMNGKKEARKSRNSETIGEK